MGWVYGLGRRGARRVILALAVAAALGAAAPAALAAPAATVARLAATPGSEPQLGKPPPDCGAVGRDFTDPTCTTQTRNGTFAFDHNAVHAGGTFTGEVTNRCLKHSGPQPWTGPPDMPCPILWNELVELGKIVSGCSATTATCTIRVSPKAASTPYRIFRVFIVSDQGAGQSKDYLAIVGGDWFVLAGHLVGRDGKPLTKSVGVRISGPESQVVASDRSTGLYSALLKKGSYTVTPSQADLLPVKTKECTPSGRSCSVNLIQDRTADFELPGPPLLMTIALGSLVHGPTHRGTVEKPVAKAGTAITIKATLRNTSRTSAIVVRGETLWADLAGNAFDGHLQPTAAPVYVLGDKSADGPALSPDVVLQPKQTREFVFVVRTRTLNVDWYAGADAAAAGGQGAAPRPPAGPTTTPAQITIVAPIVGVLPEEAHGKLDTVKASDVDWRQGDAGTELKGTTHFAIPLDDTDPEPPPWAGNLVYTEELLAEVPSAILSWTWGTIRGIAWDLPNAAAAWFFGQLYTEDRLLEYWDAIENAPEGKELFVRYAQAVKARLDKEHAEAKFLADNSPGVLANIQDQLSRHWTQVAKEYYSGDWRAAAHTMSEEATHGVLNVVTAVAPGALARVPGVARVANALKARRLAQVSTEAAAATEELAAVSAARIAAAEAAGPGKALNLLDRAEAAEAKVASLAKAAQGEQLAARELTELGGFSAEDQAAMDVVGSGKVTGGRKIIQMWKGRSSFAAKLKGFLGKPSWMKPKGIDVADVKYLGESATDLGTQVWTEPPFLQIVTDGRASEQALLTAQQRYVDALKRIFAKQHRTLSFEERQAAVARWRQRISEWTSTADDQVAGLVARARRAKANGGTTTVEWQLEGNLENQAIKNEQVDVNFTLDETMTDATLDPFGPRKRYVPYANSKAGAQLTRVRSDHDALFFAYENGAPLSDTDRLRVYKYLREQGILEHPDTGSYLNDKVRNAYLSDGTPTFIRNPDGKWTVGRFNAQKSGYLDPGNNRQYFEGARYVGMAP